MGGMGIRRRENGERDGRAQPTNLVLLEETESLPFVRLRALLVDAPLDGVSD